MKPEISVTSTVVAVKDQVSAYLTAEAVVLHLGNGVYYGLDEVGSIIWKQIQRPKSVEQIRDRLIEEYEVEPSQCEKDLLNLFKELVAEGLVEVHQGQPAP